MEQAGESWKDIKGYEGHYQVSNYGRVRSLDTIGENGRVYKGKIRKFSDNGKGYLTVSLKVKGKQTHKYVHRLVAEHFLPNPEDKPEVNHKDGVKASCKLSNLEWSTRLENVRHAFNTGLVQSYERSEEWRRKSSEHRKGKFAGDKNPRAKAVVQLDKDTGQLIAEYGCAKDGARALGKNSCGNIINCCKNKLNSAYGYKWMYKTEWEVN
ncbi:HNH endonuclease [Bacillus phage vB_BanH_Emiliahah]|nr:HNH endonuclease [Bacillus phage vB_BanH_Emiliahah]